MRAEWDDRYGPPPPAAEALLAAARLRAECVRLGHHEPHGVGPAQRASAASSSRRRRRRGSSASLPAPRSGAATRSCRCKAAPADVAAALVDLLRELDPPPSSIRDAMKRVVAIIACVALIVAFGVGVFFAVDSGGPDAASIGDLAISQRYVDDELQVIGENETLRDAVKQAQASALSNTDGSVTVDRELGLARAHRRPEARRTGGREARASTRPTPTASARRCSPSVRWAATTSTSRSPSWFQNRLIGRWIPIAVIERELTANPSPAFLARITSQCPSGRYVSHILVESALEAQALKQQLDAGADFADARQGELDRSRLGQAGGRARLHRRPELRRALRDDRGDATRRRGLRSGRDSVRLAPPPRQRPAPGVRSSSRPRSRLRSARVAAPVVDVNPRYGDVGSQRRTGRPGAGSGRAGARRPPRRPVSHVGAPGRVVVVGLGPGGVDLLVPAARAALDASTRRFARTARHPAVAELAAEGIVFESFDDRVRRGRRPRRVLRRDRRHARRCGVGARRGRLRGPREPGGGRAHRRAAPRCRT